MAYEFHYTPTGTGVISGKEVLEQTEDAINDLGNTAISGVQEALDKAEQALTNSENAVDDAQTALNTANNAEGVAIQAQTDVGNLSGTVTNIGNRVTTAEGNITNLQGRMTTAEGNITNLQGRMTTAEGNIGNLQTAVSTAQATANSAQQTATTARQQSYVFRYSSTALTASSTNANSLLDNTDNLKVGDKVIDSSGVLFSITAIDTQNSTFTIGTALIDLAQDSDVVHKSGNETVTGNKTFANNTMVVGRNIDGTSVVQFVNSDVVGDSSVSGKSGFEVYGTSVLDANKIGSVILGEYSNNSGSYALITCNRTVSGVKSSNEIRNLIKSDGTKELTATVDNDCKLGSAFLRWSKIYGTEYYYGSNNVEFSTKFVTTDTNQTISGAKTFSSNITLQGTTTPVIKTISNIVQDSTSGNETISRVVRDKTDEHDVFSESVNKFSRRSIDYRLNIIAINNGTEFLAGVRLIADPTNNTKSFVSSGNNTVTLGDLGNRWKDFYTNKINGVEPSSLSLPSGNANDVIDISSYITDLSGNVNNYTAPANGWISIAITGTAIAIVSSSWSDSRLRESSGNVRMLYPVLKNETLGISVTGTTLAYARFIPCQGNV